VRVEIPLKRRHRCRVQVSRAIAASTDLDLKCVDGARTDDTVRAGVNLALQGLDGARAEDTVICGADPVLDRADRLRTHPSIDRELGVTDDGHTRQRAGHRH